MRVLLAMPWWAACSLQSFDYLQHGGNGGAGAGGGGTSHATGAGGANDRWTTSGGRTEDAATKEGGTANDAGRANDAGHASDAADGQSPVPTNFIVNPNFDNYSLSGWTIAPAGSWAFAQAPQGTAVTPQGQPCELATYSASAFTVDISQTLTNLPDGAYTFAGWFNRGANNQAYIYAKGCGVPDQQVDIPTTSPTGWEQVSISGIHVTGGSCQVGFFVDAAAGNWLNADGFSFGLSTASQDAGTDGGAK